VTASLIIDSQGSISLPPAFLEKFHLRPGAKLLADLGDEGIALRPEIEIEQARLVDRDGFFVFTGTEPFSAVEAVAAARGEIGWPTEITESTEI
jgi:hypothetical protein